MDIRVPGLLLAASLLGGCASVHVAKDPLKGPAKANEGVVVLSLTVNTGEVAAFQSISLTRDQDPPAKKSGIDRSYSLTNLVPGMARDSSLFVGMLPAGDYQFRQLHAGTKFLSLADAQRELLGSFRVEAGKVTDLGRIVITAINFKVIVGRSALVASNRGLVGEVSPSHVELFGRPAGGGWNAPRNSGDQVEEYARAYPQGAGGFSELASGEVIGGSRMGAIIARNKEGRWRFLARTDRPDAVLDVAPYETNGKVAVAVGELGTFVTVDAAGKVAPVPRGNLPFGNYLFVAGAPDHSAWIVGVQRAGKAQLYGSAKLEDGDWKLVREDTVAADFWSGARPAWFWRQPGGVGYASAAARQVSCFDWRSTQWTTHSPPDNRALTSVAVGTGALGVLTSPGGGFGGIFAKTHVSRDCGKTWTETKSPYKVKMMAPLVLASGRILEGGGAFGDKGLYASADDGKSWQKVTDEVTVFNEKLWAMPTAGLIAVSLGQFGVESIETSADEGKTWKRELSSLNRQLLGTPTP